MAISVKICGIKDEATLSAAVNAGASYIGLVHFPKSPRHLSLEQAAILRAKLPKNISAVMVVVDASDELLTDIIRIVAPDYIQLHGHETPARVAEIRSHFPHQKLIKAIPISSKEDLATASDYEPYAELLLFDAKPAKDATLPGGNGVSFDWNIMNGFKSKLPWLLSGGLTPENIAEAIQQSGASMVDVSSGVESSAGVKDAGKIKAFIQAAKP